MPAPATIHQLVARFTENREAYRSGKYNEARRRQEFLDPFFVALGWDVYNQKGVAPQYADVEIEASLDIEGTSKSPDYTFKVGSERKFFVEAKKPAVNIRYDIHPAFQLRRYAWNAHLPISILTDFEEFAVYNCMAKPGPKETAATARDLFYLYTDYIEKWDEIAAIFSRDAVWKGALDRFAASSKGKKGTTEVDDEFLKDMNNWRVLLARNIALRNPRVEDEQQLNYAVQITLDRIIFLRICEDRGIEPEEQLKTLSTQPGVYAGLLELFRHADLKYNSGLFNFTHDKDDNTPPDTFTPSLTIDDRALKEIIQGLYYPCPYIFKEIPVEILGQVYEQFLGQVIRLTAGHQAKVEEKPEVRKAGGVYYTPKYIVDYIVENTVGKLLEGKTPTEAAALKIVDPACGSGSFLLGAFQYLIDWHERWYLANEPQKWTRGKAPALNEVTGGYRLTTLKKKEILLNNIHGVDIDPQAVEVTKLSLLLKVLEEETGQLSLGLERALPDLGRNIQCGNSLIGEDYFAGQLTVDPAERRRVNPFEWERAFPGVFAQGGFDAVIGNPPYGAFLATDEEKYLVNHFETISSFRDVYICFIEKAVNLLKQSGTFSYIIPSGWTGGPGYIKLRNFLLTKKIRKILLLPFDIFSEAYIDTLVLVASKAIPNEDHVVETYVYPKKIQISEIRGLAYQSIAQNTWLQTEDKKLILKNDSILLLNHLSQVGYSKIKNICDMKRGVLFDKKLLSPTPLTNQYHPYFEGDVYRYSINIRLVNWVEFSDKLRERPKEFKWFQGDRILLRRLVNRRQRLMGCFTDKTFITNKNLYSIIPYDIDTHFLLGVINSQLISYLYINQVTQAVKDDFPQVTITDFLNLPFPSVIDSQISNKIKALSRHLQNLNNMAPATPQEQEQLRREIEATDCQIDQLVYQLYGLTDEEIKIVEEST